MVPLGNRGLAWARFLYSGWGMTIAEIEREIASRQSELTNAQRRLSDAERRSTPDTYTIQNERANVVRAFRVVESWRLQLQIAQGAK